MNKGWWTGPVTVAACVTGELLASFLCEYLGETSPYEYSQIGRLEMLTLLLLAGSAVASVICFVVARHMTASTKLAVQGMSAGFLIAIPVMIVARVFFMEDIVPIIYQLRGG